MRKARGVTTDLLSKAARLLERAQRVIPLGSQTFSKSRIVYPANAAPLFLSHGKGGHVWDVDGNEYVDLVNGLLPVILGYDDADVIEAVTRQLQRGVTLQPRDRAGGRARRAAARASSRARRWCASARTAATRRAARCASRARTPGATASRCAAITAGRTGTSAPPRATRAFRTPSASSRTSSRTTISRRWKRLLDASGRVRGASSWSR